MKFLFLDLNVILAMAVAAVAAIAMIGYAFFRPAENPEAIERKRRLHLNQIGRITEGQVVELAEHAPEPVAERKALFGSKAAPLGTSNGAIWSLTVTRFQASPITPRRTLPGWKGRYVSNGWLPGSPPASSTILPILPIPF